MTINSSKIPHLDDIMRVFSEERIHRHPGPGREGSCDDLRKFRRDPACAPGYQTAFETQQNIPFVAPLLSHRARNFRRERGIRPVPRRTGPPGEGSVSPEGQGLPAADPGARSSFRPEMTATGSPRRAGGMPPRAPRSPPPPDHRGRRRAGRRPQRTGQGPRGRQDRPPGRPRSGGRAPRSAPG